MSALLAAAEWQKLYNPWNHEYAAEQKRDVIKQKRARIGGNAPKLVKISWKSFCKKVYIFL